MGVKVNGDGLRVAGGAGDVQRSLNVDAVGIENGRLRQTEMDDSGVVGSLLNSREKREIESVAPRRDTPPNLSFSGSFEAIKSAYTATVENFKYMIFELVDKNAENSEEAEKNRQRAEEMFEPLEEALDIVFRPETTQTDKVIGARVYALRKSLERKMENALLSLERGNLIEKGAKGAVGEIINNALLSNFKSIDSYIREIEIEPKDLLIRWS
jgi:hypothetical protein